MDQQVSHVLLRSNAIYLWPAIALLELTAQGTFSGCSFSLQSKLSLASGLQAPGSRPSTQQQQRQQSLQAREAAAAGSGRPGALSPTAVRPATSASPAAQESSPPRSAAVQADGEASRALTPAPAGQRNRPGPKAAAPSRGVGSLLTVKLSRAHASRLSWRSVAQQEHCCLCTFAGCLGRL